MRPPVYTLERNIHITRFECMFAKILYFVFEEDIPNDDSKGDAVPVEVRPLEKRPVAVSPTDSYKNALRYSPPSGSVAGIYDVEDRMKALLRQMESIESSDSSMPEMANLFELLPKVIYPECIILARLMYSKKFQILTTIF